MAIIDISKKEKAAVFVALYNAARPRQLAYFNYTPGPMSIEEARKIIDELRPLMFFDYFRGRCMKINLTGDTVDTWLFDINNGPGAGEQAIASVPDVEEKLDTKDYVSNVEEQLDTKDSVSNV